MTAEVLITPDHDSLAAAVAARTLTALVDAIAARDEAHLCLTGGGIGTASMAAIASSAAAPAVDWSRVHLWWGDERFVAPDDTDRNDLGARAVMIDHLPVDAANVHPMPAVGGAWGNDVEAAAVAYAAELAAASGGAGVPVFDVMHLGVGPDGHVASLFPGLPGIDAGGTVVAVTGSPKPPPVRISLTLQAINAAREVWLIASGLEKAEAIARAVRQGGESGLPSGMVHGTHRTLALLDADAASQLR